jgi:acyl-CoA synthetase (AMP-forming)/AMP-acid ligase II
MHTEQTAGFSARAAWAALGMTPADIVWMPSPIGHSTGLNYGVRIALTFGLPLVLQDRWNAAEAAHLIERFRCTYTVAATTFLADLAEQGRQGGADLSSLRLFSSGGAPIPAALVEEAESLGMTVLRLYGSTEVLVATWNRPDSPRALRLATDGRPLDHVDVEVRDDAGRSVVGEPGEIFVRGPNTSVGFFADPERTSATFDPAGWVRSGDLGVLDEHGHLTIVGRRKEIIIRGGMNIAPREIEDLIRAMPAVAVVAVVGLPDSRLGEITCACVVPRREPVTLEAVVDHLRAQGVAAYKLPQRLVTVDALPTTSTGKVRKFELVEAIVRGDSR